MSMLSYKFAIKENIGGREEQQDAAGSIQTKYGFLIVVCDGMGGAKGGATASKMAVSIILQEVENSPYSNPLVALLDAITKANAEIFYRSRDDEDCQGMGTTVVALLLQQEKAIVAHVGDSRVYQLRKPELFGKRVQKVYRTNDHSKVFELVKRGIIDEEQARVSNESNIILRALGIKPTVDIDLQDDIPYLKGDRFLLCSDGISGAVPEKQLLDLLTAKHDVETTVNNLINTINKIGLNDGGGHDNMTAALVECNDNSTLKTKVDVKSKIITSVLAGVLLLSLAGNVILLIQKGEDNNSTSAKGKIEVMSDSLNSKNKQIAELTEEVKKISNTLKVQKKAMDSVSKALELAKKRPPSNLSKQQSTEVKDSTKKEMLKSKKTKR